MSSANEPRVVPAQLSFLAIYNPALGDSDETFHRQIVFYYAKAARARAQQDAAEESEEDGEKLRQTENEKLRRTENEELRQAENEKLRQAENEKLRQVGLAQGMVGFARSFASGESVDSIETEKSRIVLHELERGWWILASVDLTQLPAASTSKQSEQSEQPPAVEYSSREVSPPALLVQQLVRAHGVFTLHHGAPLAQLLSRYGRAKFCSILDTYWARFCAGWDVLLHASPAVDVFNGLKLAAGGELGVGVGEEDWGSSERDVLEHFARRTEGLVDVLVSRFGEASPAQHGNGEVDARPRHAAAAEPWLGAGVDAAATDGVVFSGVGGLSRASLRDVAHWTESIYHCGDRAYGIRDNPTADRRRRRRRGPLAVGRKPDPPAEEADPATGDAPRIPAPIVRAVESSLDRASEAVDQSEGGREPAAKQETGAMLASLGDTETWMKYMTLGYGTAWGNKKQTGPAKTPATEAQTPATKAKTPATEAKTPATKAKTPATKAKTPATEAQAEQSPNAMRYIEPAPDVDLAEEKRKAQVRAENDGYFLVGLKGDMVEADMDDDNDEGNWNARIQLRTVYVQAINKPSSTSASESGETPAAEGNVTSWTASLTRETSRLQPVVYIHRPFIYTFLFAHHTPSLTLASFYRSLHAFFAPLHRSLDRNTAPSRVAQRLLAARAAQTTTATTATAAATHGPNTWPIYDLVWDPRTLTLHSSLPNIPAPGALMADEGWSRLDALNVHAHILSTVATSRRSRSEIERTCKTSRGWWVVWMRLPPSQPSETRDFDSDSDPEHAGTRSVAFNTDELREAFLIRRARDGGESTQHKSGRSIASGMWSGMAMGMGASTHQTMGGKAAGWGPKGLAEGIGIDARRYVDELLSLNR